MCGYIGRPEHRRAAAEAERDAAQCGVHTSDGRQTHHLERRAVQCEQLEASTAQLGDDEPRLGGVAAG
eukprot:1427968-Prymnesium_polylepis.1